MATANIKAVITAEDKASNVIHGFGTKTAVTMGAVAGVVQSLAIKGMDVLSESIGGAVSRVDTLNNANRVFANMGFGIDQTQKAMANLKQSILGLPTPLNEAVESMQMIASTTGDIGKSQQIFSAMNNAILGFGGTSENVRTAVLQLSQGFANNKIGGQEWISMMNNQMGPALNAIAKNMGLTTGQLKEGLSDGTISVQRFQDELIKLNKQGGGGLKSLEQIAKDSTAGIATGFANMQTSITRGMGNIIQAIGPEKISSAIAKIGEVLEQALGKVATIIPTWQKVWNDLVGIYNTYIKPALDSLWAQIQTQLLPALQDFWDKNQNWIIPALQALGIVLGGIVLAAIMGVIYAIKGIVWVITEVITFLGNLQGWFTTAFQFISDKATWLKDHFWETVGFILGFFATLPIKIPIFVAEAILAVANFLAHVDWGGLFRRLIDAWVNLWTVQMPNAVMGLWNFIRNVDWGGLLTSMNKGIVNGISALLEGIINGALSGLPGAPKVHFPRAANGMENFSGGAILVGERGPEIVNLPRGSDVIPNDKISVGGGNTTININVGLMTGSAIERREAAAKMFEDLKDIASQRGQTVSQLIGAN